MKVYKVVLVVLWGMLSGCHLLLPQSPKNVTFVPINDKGAEIPYARIAINGQPAGQGVTTIATPKQEVSVSIDASPQYYPKTFVINQKSTGAIRVPLQLDELYAVTIEDSNHVMNRWLMLNAKHSGSDWWSIVVNAIATQDFEIELMDAQSGFIRTSWKERQFGNQRIRRRFVGNVVTPSPLSWRLKYQVQRTTNGRDWHDYNRGMKQELDVIGEIRARM